MEMGVTSVSNVVWGRAVLTHLCHCKVYFLTITFSQGGTKNPFSTLKHLQITSKSFTIQATNVLNLAGGILWEC